MNEKSDIRSVEMVRRIRDEFADLLKGKTHAEIIALFNKAGDEMREEISRRRASQIPGESSG